MFCISCASFNSTPTSTCARCGGTLARQTPPGGSGGVSTARLWPAWRWDRTRLRRLLLVAPLLLVLTTSAGAAERYRADRADRAAWYARANQALNAGLYPDAIEAFAAAGGYRDAALRRDEAVTALAPYRTSYLDGMAALNTGHHEAAIAALLPVVRDLPTYADATALLERARQGREADLRRAVDTATAAGDWLAAERALALLAAENPDDPAPRARLATLQRDHAPLVFARDGALYLIGPDGGDERLLTDAVPVSWPVWSPDKSRIAFVSLAMDSLSGNARLFTIDSSGEHLTELAQWVSPYSAPAWSPDGAKLAYTSLAAFDGARERGIISIHLLDLGSGRVEDLTGELVSYAISPTWSPQGDRLGFISQAAHNTPGDGLLHLESTLHVLTLATGDTRQIADTRISDAVRASWSPAGDWLLIYGAYQGAWYETNRTSLHLLDVATGTLTDLNTAGRHVSRPVWSPNGEHFAYVEGQTTILVRSLDLDQTSYAVTAPVAGYLSWSPEGGSLFAAAADSTNASTLISVDGSGPIQTTLDLQYDLSAQYGGPPQWSPPHRFTPPSPPTVSGTALDGVGGKR